MQSVEIPEKVQIEIKGNTIETKGSLGTNVRSFNDALIKVTKEQNKVVINPVGTKKLAKKAMMAEVSFAKHIKNDVNGVQAYYERTLQVVFAHFPMTVEAKGNTVQIKNLIGERAPRMAVIRGSTKVEVKGQLVRIYGVNMEDVTQTEANLRKACRIRKKDVRVFQDGLYTPLE